MSQTGDTKAKQVEAKEFHYVLISKLEVSHTSAHLPL